MTLILNPDNHVDYRLAAKLPLEEEQLCKAKEIIRAANLPIVLDIGANIGLYTVSLGLLPEVAQVHAFEPVRANFNQLCGNIFLNNLDGKVEAHRIAVGSSRSTAVIHVEPASTGRSRLDPAYSGDAEAFTHRETVEVFRLDEFLPITGQRIFAKIDVEGHAVDALKGMRDLLANNVVVIQAELLEYDRDQIIACLRQSGYDLCAQIDVDGYFCPGGDLAALGV